MLGFNIKNFVFKTGITLLHTIASSGFVQFVTDNQVALNSGDCQWPSNTYLLAFNEGKPPTLKICAPIYFGYNIKISKFFYCMPELSFALPIGNRFNWGYYGETWGNIYRGEIGLSIFYSVLKQSK
jgi:hypothetical protein